MRNRNQVIWDLVQSWLKKAEGDLRAAEVLAAAWEGLAEAVGFHAQQAAEKFIKAYLVSHQIEFRKTHDLTGLRALVSRSDERLAGDLAFADWLTRFAVQARYPSETVDIDEEMAKRAVADAKGVRHLVLEALREYLARGRPE